MRVVIVSGDVVELVLLKVGERKRNAGQDKVDLLSVCPDFEANQHQINVLRLVELQRL